MDEEVTRIFFAPKTLLICNLFLFLTFTNVYAQFGRSIGVKFGYQKYTYKTYQIEHEHKSFLFSKRSEDGFILNVHLNHFTNNHVVVIPSFDIFRSTNNTKIIPNIDCAHYEYRFQKILFVYGFGLGLNDVKDLYSENKLKLNVNSYISISFPIDNRIAINTEMRFFPVILGGNIDESPFQGLAGLSYRMTKIQPIYNQNNQIKYFFYGIVGAAAISRIICLIYQFKMPWT